MWVRNSFSSLRIVDGSGAVFRIVASSEMKAVELDVQWWLTSTSNCFSSCFLHAPVGDPFYERCNAFRIQTESLENLNFVVIFELLPIDKEAAKLRNADRGRVVALTTGMLLLKLTFFPHRLHSNSNSSTVFCFTEENSNSVSFSQSQCCRLLKLPLTMFSSEVDVVRRSCPSQNSSSPLLVRFSIEWLAFLMKEWNFWDGASFKYNLQDSLLTVLLLHAVLGEWLQFSGLDSFVYL